MPDARDQEDDIFKILFCENKSVKIERHTRKSFYEEGTQNLQNIHAGAITF